MHQCCRYYFCKNRHITKVLINNVKVHLLVVEYVNADTLCWFINKCIYQSFMEIILFIRCILPVYGDFRVTCNRLSIQSFHKDLFLQVSNACITRTGLFWQPIVISLSVCLSICLSVCWSVHPTSLVCSLFSIPYAKSGSYYTHRIPFFRKWVVNWIYFL